MKSVRRFLGPLVALFAAILLLSIPVAAFALTDSLTWVPVWDGPDWIPNPNPELGATPVAGAFNAVAFEDADHVWAVGRWVYDVGGTLPVNHALFARSSDGGSTWTSGTIGTSTEMFGVAAPSATTVVAVGAAGRSAYWTGTGWSEQTLSGWTSSYSLRAVAFADANVGWAVGDGEGIARTSDGGRTWTTVRAPSSTGVRLRGVAVVDATTCIAVGDGGAMRRITTTSQALTSGTTSNLYGVTFVGGGSGWAVGDGPTVVRTVDGGAHWTSAATLPMPQTPQPVPESERYSRAARAAAFVNPLVGVVVGRYQTVWRTVDGGDSWSVEWLQDVTTDGGIELRGVAFQPTDDSRLVIVGREDASGPLDSSDFVARAYKALWTGRGLPRPSDLTLEDGGGPGATIRVSWKDTAAEDGYQVERSTRSTGGFTRVGEVSADTASFIDSADVTWVDTYFYRVRAFRGEQYSEWTTSTIGFKVDTMAPTTTSDAQYAYDRVATISLVATDYPGSGVIGTDWTLDGVPGTGTSVQTDVIGTHTLVFWSTDRARNQESPHQVVFSVYDGSLPDDAMPPSTTRVGSPWTYYAAPAVVSLAATDSGGSGVLATFCSVDGASEVETTTLYVATPGKHTVLYWSVDLRGNVETTKSMTFTVITRPTGYYPSQPVVATRVRHSPTAFTTYGYVKYHTSGTYPVTLKFYRYKSGAYVYYKSVKAKVSTVKVPGTDFSKYSVSTTLPYTGAWRVRAMHTSGGVNLYSPYSYLTVY